MVGAVKYTKKHVQGGDNNMIVQRVKEPKQHVLKFAERNANTFNHFF